MKRIVAIDFRPKASRQARLCAGTAASPDRGRMLDPFSLRPRAGERLDPGFARLLGARRHAAARKEIADTMKRMGLCNLQFVQRLRRSFFEASLLQLYLCAMLSESGHAVKAYADGRRMVLEKNGSGAFVEAVGPLGPFGMAGSGVAASALGDALLCNLVHPAIGRSPVNGRPLVVALADTEAASLSGRTLPAALLSFLLGRGCDRYVDCDGGECTLLGRDAADHVRGLLPPGLFTQPCAKDVSAVLLCADGASIAKFDRMGLQREPGVHRTRAIRYGRCRTSANGLQRADEAFVYEVGAHGVRHEAWNEGTVLIHNPFARHPLPRGWLGASVEVSLSDDRVEARFLEPFHPYTSVSEILRPDTPDWWIDRRIGLLAHELQKQPPGMSND